MKNSADLGNSAIFKMCRVVEKIKRGSPYVHNEISGRPEYHHPPKEE
jgi:hypothetical protein